MATTPPMATIERPKRGTVRRNMAIRQQDTSMQAEWRRNIQDGLDGANEKIDRLTGEVAGIKAILDTYAQMAQSLSADRMSRTMYEAMHKAMQDRVATLEGRPVLTDRLAALEKSPSTQRAWIAIGVSVIGVLGSIGCGGASVAVSVLVAIILHR